MLLYRLIVIPVLETRNPRHKQIKKFAQIQANWLQRGSLPRLPSFRFLCFLLFLPCFTLFGLRWKISSLPSLAYPLYSRHFRAPLSTLGRSFPSPEGIHWTAKDTKWARRLGSAFQRCQHGLGMLLNCLGKRRKGTTISQDLSPAPSLLSHILTVWGLFFSRMFSISRRIIL